MKRLLTGSPSLVHTAIGGVMTGVAFPPIGFWPLAWGAMIPLFIVIGSSPRDRAFIHGFIFFFLALGIPYHWVALHRMTTPALVSIVAVLAVIVSAAAVVTLFAGIGREIRPVARIIAAVSSLLLFEQILIYGPVPFPSAVLGYAMADAVWLDPVVRVFGVSGVSVLLVGASAAAAASLSAFSTRPARRARHAQALLVLAAFLAGWISGPLPAPPSEHVEHVDGAPRDQEESSFRLTLVQPALPPEVWADVDGVHRIRTLENRITGLLRLTGNEPLGVVVLPETALPAPALKATGTTPEEWVKSWSARLGAPVLAGAIIPVPQSGIDSEPGPDGSYMNVALFADSTLQRYDKQILVPFAERVPLVDVLPFMGALSVPAGGVAGYVPGRQSAPLRVGDLNVGVLICFESLFPQLALRHFQKGADMLVVLTQDGWWRSNAVRRQHLLYSRMRAVETGHPLIQVSVDGETGIFDHRGRLRVHLPTESPALHIADIDLSSRSTLFTTWGDLPVQILIAVSLIVGVSLLSYPGLPDPSS